MTKVFWDIPKHLSVSTIGLDSQTKVTSVYLQNVIYPIYSVDDKARFSNTI